MDPAEVWGDPRSASWPDRNLPLCPLLATSSSTSVITVERTVERKVCDSCALLRDAVTYAPCVLTSSSSMHTLCGVRADVTSGWAGREERGLRDLLASPAPLPQPPSWARTLSAAGLRRLLGTDDRSKCAAKAPLRLLSRCGTRLRERRDGGLDLLALHPQDATG
ncbi:Hypothetical predicted protein [Pelobates cultripes]|uniref:Uncharacterized protein n=1 Tax=Pelobates cultripes TaxID=61616 RepID=A0AAD1VM59_PELCU|nr:Hypothetical predicted protein [Pelobates cultripes]